jgi:hypothetical protein
MILGVTDRLSAEEPLIVGDYHPARITTPQNYAGPADAKAAIVWRHELRHPGATYIAIHFVNFDLAPGDVLHVSDPDGGQAYTMEGKGKRQLGEFWAQHVKGEAVVLELVATNPDGGYGFDIDEYAAGFVDLGDQADPRAICAPDDKENAICYQSSHPTEYARSHSVARILMNGAAHCTGWLASGQSHLLTNEHCITSQTQANNADFEFMSDTPTCASANCTLCFTGPTVISGATFIMDNAGYDFALVHLAGDPANTYGYLEIDNRVAIPGEEIYIPQHPGGRAKELAIFSTHSSDSPSGIAHVFSITQPPCSGSGFNDVGYYADTEGGSSGSPVLARSSHKVIALHHCANCPNRGVPIHLIYPLVEQHLTPGPAGRIELDATAYACDDSVSIDLRDGNLLGTGTHSVTLASTSGDTESKSLTETGASTGVFVGSVPASSAAGSAGDGILQVVHGDTVTVTYADADDGNGSPAVVQDTAAIDCIAPAISSVAAAATGPVATASFQTDEPACGAVHYGVNCASLTDTVAGDCGVSSHTILFSGLDPLTTYFYGVEATDGVGNSAFEDNSGACYQFTTPDFEFFFYDDFLTTTLDPVNWTSTVGGPTVDAVGTGEPSAPNSLRLNGSPSGNDAVESRVINLAGKTGLDLQYWYEQTGGGESPDANDDLYAEYWNGSAWVQLAQHLGSGPDMSVYAQNVISLPPAAYHNGFRIRLRVTATSGAFDDWFVDDVVIQPMPPAPPTASDAPLVAADEDESVNITLLGADPNGDDLSFVITTLPTIGELTDPQAGAINSVPYTLANQGNVVSYLNYAGQVGADSFTFRVNDGTFDSNTANASVFVFAPSPQIITAALPDGVIGMPYGPVQFEASGGQPTIVWSQVTDLVYAETGAETNAFAEVGVAQGWKGDDIFSEYPLPFAFPFYGSTYTGVRVWSNGFLNFGVHTGSSHNNSDLLLIDNKRIAPLWDDLITNGPGDDIFVDASNPGQVTIRWKARTYSGGNPCNFSVTLHESGDIAFHYGAGNVPITATVGISNGNGSEYTLSMHNPAVGLTETDSVVYTLLQDLPDGITIDAAGVLSGMPTESGSFDATFRVTDSLGRSDQQSYTLWIAPFTAGNHDYDGDGDVDLFDATGFQRCFGGDSVVVDAGECGMFYSDPDGDVDLVDFAAFLDQLAGP